MFKHTKPPKNRIPRALNIQPNLFILSPKPLKPLQLHEASPETPRTSLRLLNPKLSAQYNTGLEVPLSPSPQCGSARGGLLGFRAFRGFRGFRGLGVLAMFCGAEDINS